MYCTERQKCGGGYWVGSVVKALHWCRSLAPLHLLAIWFCSCRSSACIWVFEMKIEGRNQKKRRERLFSALCQNLGCLSDFYIDNSSCQFDPLLSNKTVCGGPRPVCSARRGCGMKRMIQWTLMGEGLAWVFRIDKISLAVVSTQVKSSGTKYVQGVVNLKITRFIQPSSILYINRINCVSFAENQQIKQWSGTYGLRATPDSLTKMRQVSHPLPGNDR